jgi:hypothetical protein
MLLTLACNVAFHRLAYVMYGRPDPRSLERLHEAPVGQKHTTLTELSGFGMNWERRRATLRIQAGGLLRGVFDGDSQV